jgi:hypothetical protein
MKYLFLDGFPKGLDARKFNLNAPAGTLVELQNGHLTNAGEVEKRKAFVEYADLTTVSETGTQLIAGLRLFGLQRTGVGLTVFGSAVAGFAATTTTRATTANVATLGIGAHALAVGNLVTVTGITGYTAANVALTAVTATTISYANTHADEVTTADVTGTVRLTQSSLTQPVLNASMPTGITYQKLTHPAVTDGTTYDKTKHALVSSGAIAGGVKSWVFGGLIYALATFADGKTFGFYDGTVDRDFTDGLVLAHLNTNVKLATAITELFNRSEDFTASQLPNPNDHKVNITGPTDRAYETSTSVESAAGVLTATKTSDPTDAVAARRAIGSFAVVAGSSSAGVNEITNIEVGPAAGPLVSIMGATDVDWTTSNEVTAGLLADSINTAATSPEYTAVALGNVVEIRAEESVGDTPNDFVVKVSAAGNVCIGRVQFQVIATSGFTNAVCWVGGVNVSGTVAWTTSPAATATAIANAINAGTTGGGSPHGILANALGAIVTLSKAVTRSDDAPIPAYFVVTGGNSLNGIVEVDTGTGAVSGLAVLLISSAPVSVIVGRQSGFWKYTFTAIVSGGVPPYQTLQWFGGVTVIDSRHAYIIVGHFNPVPANIYCTVTDSGGNTARSNNAV